jgi:endonuclease V-like protein UPF0215 family
LKDLVRQQQERQHRLHLNKRGMRVLGVAESFGQRQTRSTIAGVVMRGDLVIDGFALGTTTVGGDDATESIARLYTRLHRSDVNLVMLSGCIISKYNIVDLELLSRKILRPVVCLTYNETAGIESTLAERFPHDKQKLRSYRLLGKRKPLKLRSGYTIYVRTSNLSDDEARAAVDAFTLQGSIPEPVRVAKLLARSVSSLPRSSRPGSATTSGRRSL